MTSPSVLVRGEARLLGPPDLATLRVDLQAGGRRSSDVHDQLASRLQQLRAVLADHEAAVEDVSTTGIQVSPTFDEGRFDKPRGYQGSVYSSVAVNDFGELSDILLALTGIELCTVNGPEWSFRADNPIFRRARLAAVEDARTRAEDYAAAFGAHLTSLVEIADVADGGYRPDRRALSMSARGGAQPALELEPAEQEAVGQITVRFALSDPAEFAS